jgi:hypothetical protein
VLFLYDYVYGILKANGNMLLQLMALEGELPLAMASCLESFPTKPWSRWLRS